ncbi:hypothetical protein HanIR_Chr02g0072691 [Helianthus annuus]|nr:hypothetical protein HanIR_Chr02g0072691 [Helianthus annuus]
MVFSLSTLFFPIYNLSPFPPTSTLISPCLYGWPPTITTNPLFSSKHLLK